MRNLRTGYANPNEAFFQIRLKQYNCVQIDFSKRASLVLQPYEAEALGVFLAGYLAGATDELVGETHGTECYIGVIPSEYAADYVTVHVSEAYFEISTDEAAVVIVVEAPGRERLA